MLDYHIMNKITMCGVTEQQPWRCTGCNKAIIPHTNMMCECLKDLPPTCVPKGDKN